MRIKFWAGKVMKQMKCPDNGARRFDVKDQEDQCSVSEFSSEEGITVYMGDETEAGRIEVLEDIEIF